MRRGTDSKSPIGRNALIRKRPQNLSKFLRSSWNHSPLSVSVAPRVLHKKAKGNTHDSAHDMLSFLRCSCSFFRGGGGGILSRCSSLAISLSQIRLLRGVARKSLKRSGTQSRTVPEEKGNFPVYLLSMQGLLRASVPARWPWHVQAHERSHLFCSLSHMFCSSANIH